jgi:hypothetical protein
VFGPLKLDFNNDFGLMDDGINLPMIEEAPLFADLNEQPPLPEDTNIRGNPNNNISDYPSLRDLETSNVFSGVNHNFNI